jgi:hypothetical protein
MGAGGRMMTSNELCSSIVAGSQGQYSNLLTVLWWALLQDAAVVLTQAPEVQLRYRSVLFGDASAAVLGAVEPCYAAAWPVVLGALAARFPGLNSDSNPGATAAGSSRQQQQQQHAVTSGSDWEEFVQQTVTASAGGPGAHSSSGSKSGAGTTTPGQPSKGLQERLPQLRSFLVDFALWGLTDSAAAFAAAVAGDEEAGGLQSTQSNSGGTVNLQTPVAATTTAAAAAEAAHRLCLCLQTLQVVLSPCSTASSTVDWAVPTDVAVQVLQQVAAVAGEVLLPLQASRAVAAVAASSGITTCDASASAWGYVAAVAAAAARLVNIAVARYAAAGGQQQQQQDADAAADFESAALDVLLLLTSVAAPYHVIQTSSSGNTAEGQPSPPLYGPAPGSTVSSGTAAAVQDCLDAGQQLLVVPGRTADTLDVLGQLSVRLMLTVPLEGAAQPAVPAQLLEGAVKLLGSCLAADTSSSDAALQAACQLQQALTWAASSSSSSGAGRLPALYSGLFTAAAAALQAGGSGSAESAAAVDLVNTAVTAALQSTAGVDCAAAACEALRGLLQEAVAAAAAQQRQGPGAGAGGGGGKSGRQQLARQCLGGVGPQVRTIA